MKHFLMSWILIFGSAAFAGAPQMDGTTTDGKPVVMLVLPDSDNHVKAGAVTFETTPQRADALTILRNELNRQAAEHQAQNEKDGVFKSTTKRFPAESVSFFIAIGAVTFNSMWIKSHGDPTQMTRHLESIKDPIAHLSFYAFMQTQGFYMDFRSRQKGLNAMDENTRRQMMRRLSYQGMAVGSLASSIVADLGHSAKQCVDTWLKGKKDEYSLMACNEAWSQWTVRNKFSQYFPQILTMWAAQAATEFVEARGSAAFSRVSASAFMQKILRREFLVNSAYKIVGADTVMTFAGGGWFLKSIKVVGKVTRFSMFVGIDQLLSNYTYRPINNLLKPMLFDFDVMSLNNSWSQADRANWNSTNPQDAEKFVKKIKNFDKQLQQWRAHLNQDAEADLAGWMEQTKEILNQIDYAYKFYKGFSNSMFETLQIGHQIHTNQLNHTAATVITRYPLRTLPFYGVKPGAYQAIGARLEDFYLIDPNELAQRQKEHVLSMGRQYTGRANDLKQTEKDYFNRIVTKLKSGNDNTMASGLNDLNRVIAEYQRQVTSNKAGYSSHSTAYVTLLYGLKRDLGNPQPVIYPFAGYVQAFSAYEANQVTAKAAGFGKWSISQKYRFNKEADLMMYQLICGNEKGRLHKIQLAGVNFTTPQFEPPTLLKQDRNRDSFCNSWRNTGDLYSTQIAGKSLRDYVLANLNYGAVGDFRTMDSEKMTVFERWWLAKAKAPLQGQFKEFDQKYKRVVDVAYNNFFDHRSFYKWLVDNLNQSRYLPKSMESSLKFESNLYLQLLNRSVMNGQVATPREESMLSRIWNTATISPFNYMQYVRKDSEKDNYNSMYRNSPAEIRRLHQLLNGYFDFFRNPNLNFNNYIAHSKKLDIAINDVLVLAGLKRVAGEQFEDDLILDQSAPAATGTENSQKVYEDVQISQPNFKQQVAIAAVQGVRSVEAEIRRFIRMRVALAQTLDFETAEFMNDYNNTVAPRRVGHGHAYGGN
ncbi:hypothetical protein [Pseudobdellovibrio exovorus]|uniref:Uncharacterized protein n=1 Tax=Pseudobdellovibrio exovorus JSS TaxID=1184267 RepID=M4VTM4_9BACT|nr:hypothetical protein [Pseudobdellovibrio exovorus]AGH96544.1 hypothetical protein A11Q_2328 [Pseudobdellovibrio exovorus JSS]